MSPLTSSTDGLLAALRRLTDRPTLTWESPPARLAGGFWAQIYVVELANAPPGLEGRLVARIMPDPTTAAFETAVQVHLTNCGFSVPAIRCADGPSLHHVDARQPAAGGPGADPGDRPPDR
jgi:hypothetical protein